MVVNINKLEGEPVLVVTCRGHITVQDARQIFAATADVLADHDAVLYRVVVIDTDASKASFDDLKRLTVLSSKGGAGSTTDPKVRPVLVGEHLLIDLFAEAMAQPAFGGVQVPVFATLTGALAYVRGQIARQSAGTH